MCGEDGTQRGVYKLKEEHGKGGGTEKEEKKQTRTKKDKGEQRKSIGKKKAFVIPTLNS